MAVVHMVVASKDRIATLVFQGFIAALRQMDYGALRVVVGSLDRDTEYLWGRLDRWEQYSHPAVSVLTIESINIIIARQQHYRSALLRQFALTRKHVDGFLQH